MKKNILQFAFVFLLAMVAFINQGACQLTGNSPGKSMTAKGEIEIIDTISKLLLKNYIFPGIADKMSAMIKNNRKEGKYEQATSDMQFARMVMQDLRTVSKDKHILLSYQGIVSNQNNSSSVNIDTSYGIIASEMMPGDIGYLKFNYFPPGSDEAAKKKYGNVFTGFTSAKAIIIDLTDNYGGNTQMEAYLCSYFFGDTPRHLWDGYYRPGDTTYSFYTQKDLDGTRHPDIPVYVLTSSGTFSAGEAFAYDLQAQQRAKIVGETTPGGAHPTAAFDLGNGFMMRIPVTKITNAVTKADWEGTGVKPDISCLQYEAYDMAYLYALKDAARTEKNKIKKQELDKLINSKLKQEQEFIKANEKLQEYAGSYGIRKIVYSKGKIYFQREQEPYIPMKELQPDLFVWGDNRTQLKFNRDVAGKLTGFDIIRPNETIPVKKD